MVLLRYTDIVIDLSLSFQSYQQIDLRFDFTITDFSYRRNFHLAFNPAL